MANSGVADGKSGDAGADAGGGSAADGGTEITVPKGTGGSGAGTGVPAGI